MAYQIIDYSTRIIYAEQRIRLNEEFHGVIIIWFVDFQPYALYAIQINQKKMTKIFEGKSERSNFRNWVLLG